MLTVRLRPPAIPYSRLENETMKPIVILSIGLPITLVLVSTLAAAPKTDVAPKPEAGAETASAPEPNATNDETNDEPQPSTAKAKLVRAKCGSTKNVHRFGNIYLAGQPQTEDLHVAREAGIKTIINLRQRKELDWDEAAAVKNAGLNYHHIPFHDAKTLTDDVFSKTRKLLGDKKKQPLMLHCGSANRVGAIWLVHRVLDDGIDVDVAVVEAKQVGLRVPSYLEKAKDYIARTKANAEKDNLKKETSETAK